MYYIYHDIPLHMDVQVPEVSAYCTLCDLAGQGFFF